MTNSRRMAVLSEQELTVLTDGLRLSTRQAEIARLISQGMSDKQIAWQLGISFGTLRTHMSRLFQKCDVKDRLELLARIYVTVNDSRQNHPVPLFQRGDDTGTSDSLSVKA